MGNRKNITLLKDESLALQPGSTRWCETGGYINSVYASLAEGSTSGTVDVYVANSSVGPGVKIGSFALTSSKLADGFSLPKEDSGWFFIRAELTAINGTLKVASACVGE